MSHMRKNSSRRVEYGLRRPRLAAAPDTEHHALPLRRPPSRPRRRGFLSSLLAKTGLCCLLGVIASLGFTAVASAENYGFANANWTNSPTSYQNYYNDPAFENLQKTLGAPVGNYVASPPPVGTVYQRFNVPYDVFATSDGTNCINSSTTLADLGRIESAVSDAENPPAGSGVTPQHPMIALWLDVGTVDKTTGVRTPTEVAGYQAGTSLPIWPTDRDLECATQAMEQDFLGYPAMNGGPLVNSSTKKMYIEPANEPDQNTYPVADSCEPGNANIAPQPEGAECAARYFADVYQGLVNSGTTADAHVIAGAFTGQSGTIPANTTKAASNCGAKSYFMPAYICWLQAGDSINIPGGGGTLKSYNQYATSWSFHDYDDVNLARTSNCYADLSTCTKAEYIKFDNTLSVWGEPENDEWITEAGYNHNSQNCPTTPDPSGYCPLTDTQELNAANDWVAIAAGTTYGPPKHMFWYQWNTDPSDPFDAALANGDEPGSALPRQSECYLTGQALSLCTGAANTTR